MKEHDIKYELGYRVDSKNHNWLIIQRYLSLSFSYMSFVIMDAIEKNHSYIKKNQFDVEPYNYIFNKSNAFLDS